MKIATEDFARMASACARIADAKNPVPAFRNVLLSATDGRLTVTASNGEYWLTLHSPCEGDLAPTLAPADKLADAAGKMKADTLDIDLDGSALTIKAKGSRRKLQVSAGDAFPALERFDGTCLLIDAKRLVECFAFAGPFADTDAKTRANMCGINLQSRDGKLCLAATDGDAIAMIEYGEAPDIEPVTVPVTFAREAERLGMGDSTTLLIGKRKVALQWPEGELVAPLVEGKFPAYMQAVPIDPPIAVTAQADDLASAASGTKGFGNAAGKFGAALAISPDDSGVTIQARTGEGEAVDTVAADVTGNLPPFGLSSAYLERTCKAFAGERLSLLITEAVKPILARVGDGMDRFAIIMPRRI